MELALSELQTRPDVLSRLHCKPLWLNPSGWPEWCIHWSFGWCKRLSPIPQEIAKNPCVQNQELSPVVEDQAPMAREVVRNILHTTASFVTLLGGCGDCVTKSLELNKQNEDE